MILRDQIKEQIRAQGPMSVAAFMQLALLHPTQGYYTTRDPFGPSGDFVTAPEISQMFGELIGLALAQCWLDQGSPAQFTLAELGPGRGTLMRDILRATRNVSGFVTAADISLLEVSPSLRKAQADLLSGHKFSWVDSAAEFSEQPLFVVANEFFDALPIRQYVRAGHRWHERQIGLDREELAFGLGPAVGNPALDHRLDDTKDGDLVEICPEAVRITQTLAGRISASGGAALIIDYGDWRSLGDTLQALKDHAATDPLSDPGRADLTTHVDFEALAQASELCAHTRLTPQGVFLERLGITARARALAEQLEGDALDNHVAAHRRLTHPEEMGNLFKVMGIVPKGATPPPGLEA